MYIFFIKYAVINYMKESCFPLSFWDYCVARRARIDNLNTQNLFELHVSNSYTTLTGDEGGILNLCQYVWYYWCYYNEQTSKFLFNK